ncbi:hypothetical protein BGZ83_010166 [Gryganskiella cystojenkinii]|nr:hypothetical protein BGZ83_010166 [Gryganskiella cystojenkinii]
MSVLRNALARTVRISLSRNAIAARPFSVLASQATRTNTLLTRFQIDHADRRTFATHLPNDFTHPDASLIRAQELVDEGAAFHSNGMVPLAMSSFQKSINERPTACAHYNMGVCYFEMRDYQSAIHSFQESLKLYSDNPDVHANLAVAHIQLNGNKNEAFHHFRAAANLAPEDSEIQFNLAVTSEALGDFDTAIAAYAAAEELGMEKAGLHLRNVKTKKFAKLMKEAEVREQK